MYSRKVAIFLSALFFAPNAQAMLALRTKAPQAAQLLGRGVLPATQRRYLGDLVKPFLIVKNAESRIIERFGKFSRVLSPGLHFKIPFVEDTRKLQWTFARHKGERDIERKWVSTSRVDLREVVYEIPRRPVITQDNVVMDINAMVYYRITSAQDAAYEVQDMPRAVESLTQTTLRNVIGTLRLDETLVSRGRINENLRDTLNEAARKWGVEITRVELQEVSPPPDIIKAMEQEMSAERFRRAKILDAEGDKSAAVLRAEGAKEAAIRTAEGEAAARLKLADAESQSLEMIRSALQGGGDPASYILGLKYISALPEMTKGGEGKTVVVPYDSASLVGATSMLREILTGKKES